MLDTDFQNQETKKFSKIKIKIERRNFRIWPLRVEKKKKKRKKVNDSKVSILFCEIRNRVFFPLMPSECPSPGYPTSASLPHRCPLEKTYGFIYKYTAKTTPGRLQQRSPRPPAPQAGVRLRSQPCSGGGRGRATCMCPPPTRGTPGAASPAQHRLNRGGGVHMHPSAPPSPWRWLPAPRHGSAPLAGGGGALTFVPHWAGPPRGRSSARRAPVPHPRPVPGGVGGSPKLGTGSG